MTRTTDKKVFNEIFKELRQQGFIARQHFACCSTCAWAEIDNELIGIGASEEQKNVVFYHSQDSTSFDKETKDLTSILYLSWRGDGEKIAETVRKHGFEVKWDGTEAYRIGVMPRPENIRYQL